MINIDVDLYEKIYDLGIATERKVGPMIKHILKAWLEEKEKKDAKKK